MKRVLFLFFVTMCSFITVFGQLRVSNNFGQDLNVTVNGNKQLVPYKGAKTFRANGRTVWFECQTVDGKTKFNFQREVSRSGLIKIEVSDNAPVASVQNQSINTTVIQSSLPSQTSSSTLSAILGGGKSQSNTQSSSIVSISTPQQASMPASSYVPVPSVSAIAFVYKGIDKFKIFSDIGRGLEFKGADSLNPEDNAKNRYILNIPRNQDLIIGLGIKEGENQAVWRYAEIRKRVNSWDTACYVYQKDIKKMSTTENKNLRIKLIAEDYKIVFEPESGDIISLGYRGVSRSIEVPIGQFYIRVSYTDTRGMFHRTVFVPKHVTAKDRYLEFSKNDLDNAVQLTW